MSETKIDRDLKRLEELVNEMESGKLDLDDALGSFQMGIALVKRVSNKLKNAELQVKEITEKGIEDFQSDNIESAQT